VVLEAGGTLRYERTAAGAVAAATAAAARLGVRLHLRSGATAGADHHDGDDGDGGESPLPPPLQIVGPVDVDAAYSRGQVGCQTAGTCFL